MKRMSPAARSRMEIERILRPAIFLDIDGVLVTRESWHDRRFQHANAATSCVEALNEIIKRTNAFIVVSSTWRRGTPITELRTILNQHFAIVGDVVGKTPQLETQSNGIWKNCRGDEIQKWLDSFEGTCWEPLQFVILDDDNDMGNLASHLIQTTFDNGLTMEHAERAISLLTPPPQQSELIA